MNNVPGKHCVLRVGDSTSAIRAKTILAARYNVYPTQMIKISIDKGVKFIDNLFSGRDGKLTGSYIFEQPSTSLGIERLARRRTPRMNAIFERLNG